MEELIAKRYAQALTSATKNIADDAALLNALSEALQNTDAKNILNSPMIAADKKTEMVLNAVGKGSNERMNNFIKVLGEKKRLDLIPAIAKVLNFELQKEANVYEGVVKSANVLDNATLADLEETLKKYTGATVKLSQEKSTLEGLRVTVDDLGIEVNFSKQRVKEQLIDYIKKAL